MSRTSLPTLRRNHSSSDGSCVDPYDKAEQGFQDGLEDLSSPRPPLEPKKTFSFRSSLHSSDSTLVGIPSREDTADYPRGRPLPHQEQQPCETTWTTRCFSGLPRLSFLGSISEKPPQSPAEDYQLTHDQFQIKSYDKYPNGWPRVAAFLESCDSFSIYRRFGQSHTRLLVTHQCNITDLEDQIQKLDKSDDEGGPDMQFRLKTRYHEDGFDTTKRDLLEKLEKELIAYDALLLNYHRLKSLESTPISDYQSVLNWIWQNQPIDMGEYNWIFHPGDFVSMVSPRRNRFENSIRHYLHSSNSFVKSFFKSACRMHETEDSSVEFLSQARITAVARTFAVFFAVSVLFIPVNLFLLVPMSRACMAVVALVFVIAFSMIISLIEATFQEIFVGTATYGAVLVTFLGNLQGATVG
ncbi:hypothetical protein EG329_000851 [Mollisiaceae sp. DMI_Dod_QoI]|nr:hypothetical protein EG329_000851 [Helotiales sp. DMI_Dod_QoI]